MYDISNAAFELMEETSWQAVPVELDNDDYINMIKKGIRRLYIDTGRAELFDPERYIEEGSAVYYDEEFLVDEEEYILKCAEIAFFKKVQTDVNNIVGYTTDALQVTNADKPYANLKNTIDDYDNERRIIYYKMVRYNLE